MTDNNIKTNISATDSNTNGNNNISSNNNSIKQGAQANTLKLKIPEQNVQNNKSVAAKPAKKKRRDKSDLGDNFVAPDGGWGWLVAIASGVNILVTFALAQQFGIIFREHMYKLGISSSQLTTIINTQVAVSAFTGLLNGPLFRRYTYRQVALVGSFLTFIGLFLAVFANSFLVYVLSFSCLYGFGRGLTVSASSLAVNTYFKQKRRTATAYQFGVAGLGPIICPYLATFLLAYFGVQGTVLIFASISLHTIACSLIYQPVRWHIKKPGADTEAPLQSQSEQKTAADLEDHFEEDEIESYAEPDTPVLPRANDGWFGSRTSLNTLTHRSRSRLNSLDRPREAGYQLQEFRRPSREGINGKPRTFSTSHSIREEDAAEIDVEVNGNSKAQMHDNPYIDEQTKLTQQELEIALQGKKTLAELEAEEDERRQKLPFYKKVAIFFDLDLLRDVTYVNLAVGLTLINFVEINFAILTPFILDDFGFDSAAIALAMSTLGFCDLVVRFLVPIITAKMNFSNKTFFIFGIGGMCIGRFFLAFTRNYYWMIAIFAFMGLNKAFRTVFWSIIIPGYVPLKRLPAAAGLQLLMSGVFSMACGPLIGLIKDHTDYAFTLNFLNALCVFAILMWVGESYIKKRRRRNQARITNAEPVLTINK